MILCVWCGAIVLSVYDPMCSVWRPCAISSCSHVFGVAPLCHQFMILCVWCGTPVLSVYVPMCLVWHPCAISLCSYVFGVAPLCYQFMILCVWCGAPVLSVYDPMCLVWHPCAISLWSYVFGVAPLCYQFMVLCVWCGAPVLSVYVPMCLVWRHCAISLWSYVFGVAPLCYQFMFLCVWCGAIVLSVYDPMCLVWRPWAISLCSYVFGVAPLSYQFIVFFPFYIHHEEGQGFTLLQQTRFYHYILSHLHSSHKPVKIIHPEIVSWKTTSHYKIHVLRDIRHATKASITRMHSSRMRTARSSTMVGVPARGGVPAQGGTCPGTPPMDRIPDTRYWKYYLAPTSLQAVTRQQSSRMHTACLEIVCLICHYQMSLMGRVAGPRMNKSEKVFSDHHKMSLAGGRSPCVICRGGWG